MRGRRARTWAVLVIALAGAPAAAFAAKKAIPPPVLDAEHPGPSNGFTFRTPAAWTVTPSPTDPDFTIAHGEGLLVRFFFQARESGFDTLHEHCKGNGLAGAMQTEPRFKYEYDYLSATAGDRRVLESAFVATYDEAVLGHREWRQRVVTISGPGQSICVMSYAPAREWKKNPRTRALLDAIVASVTLP